jgi:hypothetical protein
MDIGRPETRVKAGLPHLPHSIVQGVWNVVRVQVLRVIVMEKGRVDAVGDVGAFKIPHEPTGSRSALSIKITVDAENAPHRCDDALESGEQHRGGQVDCLIWL